MAALTDGDWTDLTEVTHIVPSEHISTYIENFNLPLNIGNLLASPYTGRGYIQHDFARWVEPTLPDPVRAGGATDTVLFMDFSTGVSSLTPVKKGVGFIIPDELLPSTILQTGIPANLLGIALRKIMEYKDLDILDSVQAATQTTGSSATVPSFSTFRSYLHTFKLLENDGQPVFVGNAYFFQLLLDEFTVATSQFAGRVVLEANFMTGGKSAYRGNILGVDLFESHNVATEAGAANNFMMTVGGEHRTITSVNQQEITVERSRGDTYMPRFSNLVVIGWADAHGLTFPDGLLECLADAAA